MATSKTWTQTLDLALKNLDPEKSGPGKTWTQKNLTQKNLDPEKHGA